MPKGNGITRKDLYDTMQAVDAKMERWHDDDAKRWEAIAGTLGGIDARLTAQEKRLDGACGDIDKLEHSDSKWKAFTALLGALGGAVTGFLTGRQG
jgi:hypothetical protein